MEIISRNANSAPSEVSWDKKGELNAYDRADAVKRLTKYAAEGQQQPSFEQSVSSMFSPDEQEQLVSRFGTSQNARMVIGQAMASPLKTFLEYRAVMRKAFRVDPLAAGALPVYDRDTENIEATVIASNSAANQTKIEGDRIIVPIFEIASNPTVKLREVKIRRFNIIDRIQVRTRQYIQEAEDAALINLLVKASTVKNTALVSATGGTISATNPGYIRRADMVKLKREIEKWDLFAQNYFMSIYRFNDIAMWGRDEVDILTQKQLVDTGLMAKLHGMNIYVTKKMPKNTILATTDPDYLGVMPIYQDIEVLPADLPWQSLFGWLFNEILGAAVFNPKGVAQLQVTE